MGQVRNVGNIAFVIFTIKFVDMIILALRMSSQRLSFTSAWRGTGALLPILGIRINVVLLAMPRQITACLDKLVDKLTSPHTSNPISLV
jgi:hypothetical protein